MKEFKEDDASESRCFKPEPLTWGEWALIALALFGILMFVLGFIY